MSISTKFVSALTTIVLMVTGVGIAAAVPPGGPSNTPGTSVVITYADSYAKTGLVKGYATGIPLDAKSYGIKIDDGRGYSDTHVHGQGNLLTDIQPDGDHLSFKVTIPCALDRSIENHWIRILAIGKDGKHYSSKSINTFKVTDYYGCTSL